LHQNFSCEPLRPLRPLRLLMYKKRVQRRGAGDVEVRGVTLIETSAPGDT